MSADATATPEAPGGNADAPDELQSALIEGTQLCEAGNFDEAKEHLRRTAERFPDSPLPHHDLSVVHLLELRRDLEHQEVWENLSDDEGHFEAAVAEAGAALEIQDDFLPARNNLGTLFALRGWWKSALEQWEISLSLSPDQAQVRADMIEARRRLK